MVGVIVTTAAVSVILVSLVWAKHWRRREEKYQNDLAVLEYSVNELQESVNRLQAMAPNLVEYRALLNKIRVLNGNALQALETSRRFHPEFIGKAIDMVENASKSTFTMCQETLEKTGANQSTLPKR